jgi:hypothetical protein
MANIILTKSDGTTDVTYVPSASTGSKREYQNVGSGLVEPLQLSVEHQLRPVGAKGSDRHIVTLRKGDVDDVTGEFTQASVQFVMVVPRASAFTDTVMKDLVKQLISYIKDANIVDLKAGVTPEGDYNVSGPFNPA